MDIQLATSIKGLSLEEAVFEFNPLISTREMVRKYGPLSQEPYGGTLK